MSFHQTLLAAFDGAMMTTFIKVSIDLDDILGRRHTVMHELFWKHYGPK